MLWNRRRFLRHAGALIAWLTGAPSSHAQPERPPRLHQIHDKTRNTRLRLVDFINSKFLQPLWAKPPSPTTQQLLFL